MNFKQKILQNLFRLYRNFETKHHRLKYLFIECTLRCNLECLHCGSDCLKEQEIPDLPLNDVLKTVKNIPNQITDPPVTVVFTGGEPLLVKNLEKYGTQLRKMGYRWGIVTNGMCYNKQRHQSLMNAGMGAATLSLDGLAANHNWLRNSPKSYSQAVEALDLLVQSPRINFDVVTCVNKRNIAELNKLYQLLIEHKLKKWRLFTIAPIGRAKKNPELLLDSKALKKLFDFIAGKRNEKKIDLQFSCEGYVGNYEGQVRSGYFFCRAGINIASILIDGSISACPNIDRSFIQGNIYHDDFSKIWQNRFQEFRNRQWKKQGICTNCPDFKYCLGNGFHLFDQQKQKLLFCHHRMINS